MYANQNYSNSYFYTPEALSLVSSQFYQAIFSQFDRIVNGTGALKMSFYSTHDLTLIAFLSYLGLWDGNNPPYASTLIFELHEDANEYSVQISYNDDLLELIGCPNPCEYSKFKSTLITNITENVPQACQLQNPGRNLVYNYNPFVEIMT